MQLGMSHFCISRKIDEISRCLTDFENLTVKFNTKDSVCVYGLLFAIQSMT